VKNLPDRLRKFREINGMSLQTVASRVGVHKSVIHRYETGVATPNIARLAQLAEAYGVTTDQLIGGAS
jgi:transcriptional regulator with XRE-family HTH domain